MTALAAHFSVAVAVAFAPAAAAHIVAADNFALLRSVVDTVAVADKFVLVSLSPGTAHHTLCKICLYCAHRRYTSIPTEKLVG